MTSIAEPGRERRGIAIARGAVVLAALGLFALTLPGAWAWLTVAIPATVAGSLLLAWRFGRPALLAPVLAAAIAAALYAWGGSTWQSWHVLWLPAASATGAWMGLREEGGGPLYGERAWMHAPLLLVACALPWLPGYDGVIRRLEAETHTEFKRAVEARPPGSSDQGPRMLQQYEAASLVQRVDGFRASIPSALFLGMVVLVAAGRTIAARGASMLGWPPVSRAPFVSWRLPDPALVPLLLGIGLCLVPWKAWQPSAVTLLVQSVLGYIVQGLSVLHGLMLSRGVPLAFVLLLFVFLIAFTWPVFLPSMALLGLGDVWLDFRRLEPTPRGEA